MPSSGGAEPSTGSHEDAWADLEGAVERILQELRGTRQEVQEAKARLRRLEELVGEEGDGGALVDHLQRLERENEDLRGRLAEGRELVDRILARVQFLEDRS